MLEKMGFKVNGRQVNGVYTPNAIYLNVDSLALTEQIVVHEITHSLEGTKLYTELQRAIVKYSQMKGDYASKLGEIQSLYDGVENSNIYNEVTAELVGEYLFTDEGFVNSLAVTNKNLFQRIWDEIKYISRLVTAGSPEARQLEKVKHAFEKAYNSSDVKNIGEGEARYSINDDFYKQLNKWDKKTVGFSFVVGETSKALQIAGIPKKQIRWDASKILKLLNKHSGMTIGTVMQVAELLENPVLVIDSKSNSSSKVVIGDLYDQNGKVVTAVLLLTPTSKKGNVLDMIKISSAEGRGHIQSLFKKEDGSNVSIRYIDKKRIQSWLNVNRLQLPLHNHDSDSNISISDNFQNVNNNFSLSTQNHTPTGTQGTPLNSLRYNPLVSYVDSSISQITSGIYINKKDFFHMKCLFRWRGSLACGRSGGRI